MDQADPGFLFLSIDKKREAGLDVLPHHGRDADRFLKFTALRSIWLSKTGAKFKKFRV